MAISVIVADDHPIVRASIRMEVERMPHVKTVGEASSTDELIRMLEQSHADLVVTDFSMPGGAAEDGLALLDALRSNYPDLPIIVLTMLSNAGLVRAIHERGVKALVNKSDAIGELQHALRAVLLGEAYVSPTMRLLLFGIKGIQPAHTASLSSREVEILRLFVSGMTISEIALKRTRSVKTISHQKMSAMKKLGLKNDPELYAYAHENGFLN